MMPVTSLHFHETGDGCHVARAGYVPGLHPSEIQWHSMRPAGHEDSMEVQVPRLTPQQLSTIVTTVRTAARDVLATMPVLDIVATIDTCIARMLDASCPTRLRIESLLAQTSGFHPEIIRLGMNAGLKAFRRPQLLRFLVEDFGDPGILDGFRPRTTGGWAHACGPELLAHVWAGNVPGLPLWSLVSGLLVKAGNIGKVSSDEPLVASWFAHTLSQVEPRLASALAVVWWQGGDTEMEQVFCREAELLKVYGGPTAISAWQQQVPAGKRLLAHGHKLSVGMVAASALDTRQAQHTARQAALDMVRWDQQGCYSPQLFFVERGGQVSPGEFAHHLAGELSALQHTFPRRALSLEETTSMAQWRQSLEMAQLQGQSLELLGPPDAPWCVAYVDEPRPPQAGALNRSVCVMAVERLDDAMPLLSSRREVLQTVGVAASPEELFRLAPEVARAGATRICALGAMTTPTAGWHHDGRFSLLDLVRMVDIDPSAEQTAETFATYRD